MSAPRIAAIHDLSGFGRCSLTIALPVLSAMGCQCCPMPTALLSAHTGITGFTFLDLTDELRATTRHWVDMDLQFDTIYTGFLGSAEQISAVADVFHRFHRAETLLVMDPVMGDDGQPYTTCTPELCQGMRTLAEQADVITPNLTEAAILLGISYEEARKSYPEELLRQLSLHGARSVVLTGCSTADKQTGALCYDRQTHRIEYAQTRREPQNFPGTGDLFASVLTGALTCGAPLAQAAQTAADFVRACVAHSIQIDCSFADGVEFEPLLGLLTPHEL